MPGGVILQPLVKALQHANKVPDKISKIVAYGVVHTSTPAGCQILFDGELTPSTKYYKWVTNQPAVTNKVMLLRTAMQWIIVGVVGGSIAAPEAPPPASPVIAFKSSTAWVASYPIGLSLFYMTASQSNSDGGYPMQGYAGQVATFRIGGNDAALQYWSRDNGGLNGLYFRQLGPSSASPWTSMIPVPYTPPADPQIVQWSPTVTGTSSNPSMRYEYGAYRYDKGMIDVAFECTFGGGGSGSVRINAPMAPDGNWQQGEWMPYGNGFLVSGGSRVPVIFGYAEYYLFHILYQTNFSGGTTSLSFGGPISIPSGAVLYGQVRYATQGY